MNWQYLYVEDRADVGNDRPPGLIAVDEAVTSFDSLNDTRE
jgi:hypothetical protein